MRPTIGESDTEEDTTRVPETVVVEDVLEDVEVTRATQAASLSLDSVDLTVMFKTRANVMRSPPKFLRGAYMSAMRVALHEWEAGEVVQSEERKSRAWKLFVVLPRMLSLKPPRGGLVAKSKMVERFKFFSDGRWEDLLLIRDSAMAAVQALGNVADDFHPTPSNIEQNAHTICFRWVNCQLLDRPLMVTQAEADFGQTDICQNWCFSLLAFFFFKQYEKMQRRTNTLRGPEGWGPEGWGPLGPRRVGASEGGGAQNFALFSLSRHNFLSFFLLSGIFSLNCGGV